MSDLFILNEAFSNGLSHNLINIISISSITCGILVIISKNPIVSVLFLIGLFLNIAGYLMMLGINFIGLSYLLVYVGAVSILFLFILMLINVRVSELVTDSSNSIPLAIMIGIFFNITLYQLLPSNISFYNSAQSHGASEQFVFRFVSIFVGKDSNIIDSANYLPNNSTSFQHENLFFVTSQIWDGMLAETSHITTIGNVIYTSYPLWLILTSIILLLAMVGAIVITIKQ